MARRGGLGVCPAGVAAGIVTLAIIALTPVASGWEHGWDTPTDFWWGDFGYSLLQDSQAAFLGSHYQVVSLEKCTGHASGLYTEEAIFRTAAQLKRANPKLKVLFYHSLDQAGVDCYAAGVEFAAHPEWHLKNDSGGDVIPPRIDLTNPDARAWWLAVPFNSTAGWEPGLIDGILADAAGFSAAPGVSAERLQQQNDAKHTLLAEIQGRFHADFSDGVVLGNALSEYDQDPTDPHNLEVLRYIDAVQNEHFAVFEQLYPNGSLILDKASNDLDNIEFAAKNKSKNVFCSFWPGPVIGFDKNNQGMPMWPNRTEPTTPEGWKQALLDNLAFPLAAFLSVADTNTFMAYAIWYELHQGFVTCPGNPKSCDTPDHWYPELSKPLGAPVGSRQPAGPYRWTRAFEHADVVLDLVAPSKSSVTFK